MTKACTFRYRRLQPQRLHRRVERPQELDIRIGARGHRLQTPDELPEQEAAEEHDDSGNNRQLHVADKLGLRELQLLVGPDGGAMIVDRQRGEPSRHTLVAGQQDGRLPQIRDIRAVGRSREADHPCADVGRNRRVNEPEEDQPSPVELGYEKLTHNDEPDGCRKPEHQRPDNVHVAATFRQLAQAPALIPFILVLLVLGPHRAASGNEPGEGDDQRRSDPEAQPEVKLVRHLRRDRRHTWRPPLKDAIRVEDRVQHQIAENRANERPHDNVVWQDESEEDVNQVGSDPERGRRKDTLDLSSEVDKRNRQDLDLFCQEHAG